MSDKQTKQKKRLPIVFIVGIAFFVLSFFVGGLDVARAQTANTDFGLSNVQVEGLTTQRDIRDIIAGFIQIFLGFTGLIAVIVMLYAGFLWMTAGGSPDRVAKAKKWLINGSIGLGVVVSAYAITLFIFNALGINATVPGLGGGTSGPTFTGYSGGLGGGSSIIQSHYPERGATNVSRNTKVMVTFREPMDIASIVNTNGTPNDFSDDTLKTEAIKIRVAGQQGGAVLPGAIAFTPDAQTFVIAPSELLGSPSTNTQYEVELSSEILKQNGDRALGLTGNYTWQFEVGTFIDTTPPTVESIVPAHNVSTPRNTVFQITFSEAMDPIAVSGSTASGFAGIVAQSGNDIVQGNYIISNQYRTVEFITTESCGVNSCGREVYCLPASATVEFVAKAASVSDTPPVATFPYDGIVDASGNSLDGNKNNIAEGNPLDTVRHTLKTTNEVDLVPPHITLLDPQQRSSNVALDAAISAVFDKPLTSSTVNNQSILMDNINYWISNTITEQNQTIVEIRHDDFAQDTIYEPAFTSGLQDLYQNCFNPCVGP